MQYVTLKCKNIIINLKQAYDFNPLNDSEIVNV